MPAPKRICRLVVEERDVSSTAIEQDRGASIEHFAGNPLRLQCLFRRQGDINNDSGITDVTATILATSFSGDSYATAVSGAYTTDVTENTWADKSKQNVTIDFPGVDLELTIAEGRTFEDFVIVFSFGDYTFGWAAFRLYRDGVPTGAIPAEPGALTVTTGSADPEGLITAPVGSMYHQIVAGTYVRTWIKCSGTGNTGWQ